MRRHHDHIRALGLGAPYDFPGGITNSHYAFYVEMGERRWKEVTKPPLRWLLAVAIVFGIVVGRRLHVEHHNFGFEALRKRNREASGTQTTLGKIGRNQESREDHWKFHLAVAGSLCAVPGVAARIILQPSAISTNA
jgi:hypothetical protein